MGSSLIAERSAGGGSHPAVLTSADASSGLAEMLHQFLDQTLGDGPKKIRQARRLRGQLVFRAAEDPSICVRIVFASDRVEVSDVAGPPAGVPCLTADFLTVAHLTSGAESPYGLLVSRKLAATFLLRDLPFLFRVLSFMRLSPDDASRSRRRALALIVLVLVLVVAVLSFVWVHARR